MVHPASCMVCGSGNCEEGYVNLGVFYEYEGTMYLCFNCLVQAAEIIGCLTPAEAKVNHELATDATSKNVELLEKLGVANERLAFYDGLVSGAFANAGVDVASIVSNLNPSSAKLDASSETPTVEAAGGESEAKEPVKSTGPADSKQSKLSDVTSTAKPGINL